jgi:hypothetical protein
VTKFSEPNFPALFTEQFDKLRTFDKELITALSNWSMVLKSILDGGISVDDNMDMSRVTIVTHATPGTETGYSHGLGKVPQGYIVTGQEAAGSVYDGSTANSKTTLYLKSDVASKTFRILVF